MDEDERAATLKRLSREGLSDEAKQFLARELESPLEMQSLPFSRLAGRMLMAAPKGGGKRVGEGSILGGLGDLLGGDNR